MQQPVPGMRRGMSLVELLVSLLLFSIVLTVALSALSAESRAFIAGSQRMNVLQNHRYAANVLEKDLRTVGVGVPSAQPYLIFASENAIAFNADYTTNDPANIFAVYIDPTAPDELVNALTPTRQIEMPGSTFRYPSTSYSDGIGNSPAETILFFFEPDTTTARTDDYVLYRQVNDAAPEVVARNLLRNDDLPFFEYLEVAVPTTSGEAPRLQTIPSTALPLIHSVPIHMSAGDTAQFARIDNVKAVRTNFVASNGMTGDAERTSAVSRTIHLPNAGLAMLRTCGAKPILGTSLVARRINPGGGAKQYVELEWNAAIDESGGEEDIVRYVIWRRPAGVVAWGDPIASVPAGQASYVFNDTRVDPGTYTYAIAAQDCTPSLSDMSVSNSVTVFN